MSCPNAKDGRHRFSHGNARDIHKCLACDYMVRIDGVNHPRPVDPEHWSTDVVSMKTVGEMRQTMERTGETLEEYTERRSHGRVEPRVKKALKYLAETDTEKPPTN